MTCSVKKNAGEIFANRSLLLHLIARDLHDRYAGSVLGAFWALIHPLLLMALYTTVFSVILKVRVPSGESTTAFGLFLFAGMIPWLAFQDAIGRAVNIMDHNASMIKQNYFPMVLLPLELAINALLVQAVVTIAFVLFGWPWLQIQAACFLWIPAVLLVQGVLLLAICMIVSALNPLLRDVGQMVHALMLVWFFVTPIVYPPHLIPGRLLWVLWVNPMASFVTLYRATLLGSALPSAGEVVVVLLMTGCLCMLASHLFEKTRATVVESL